MGTSNKNRKSFMKPILFANKKNPQINTINNLRSKFLGNVFSY